MIRKPKKVLVTGAAGFVGYHLCKRMLMDGLEVLGVDNFSPYYDVALKEARVRDIGILANYSMRNIDVSIAEELEIVWADFQPDVVIHLAAQAGVRHSIENPGAYVNSNLIGTYHVLELARRFPPMHLLAASTSSVYGAMPETPFLETARTKTPLSLYAATKSANEDMGHAYAHLFRIPITFFRFFTVYGPWGRPDMAYYSFAKAISEGQEIDVYNHGRMERDFTYIDDLVEAIVLLMDSVPEVGQNFAGDSLSPVAPHRVVNIGKAKPVGLMEMIEELEKALGRKAKKNFLPMQPGDVPATHASSNLLTELVGFSPSTTLSTGIANFVRWFDEYHLTEEYRGSK